MKKLTKSSFMVLLTFTVLSTPMPGFAKTIGTELSPELRLLIARQKAKANQEIKPDDYIELEDKRDDMFDESNRECGNVNIGNIHNDNKIGRRPTQVNVVVTESIVNLGNDDC